MPHSELPPVTVAVLTYHREESLPALIAKLREQLTIAGVAAGSRILIVDNDPLCGAEAVARRASNPVEYVAEPVPGIAAARQRALDSTPSDHLLAFIDDDETPSRRWLVSLIDTWSKHGRPAGVAGRVVPAYEAPPEEWITAGKFFVRRSLPTGTPVAAAGAGNLLLDLKQVRALRLTFDRNLGMRGGEDTLFTRQMTSRGGRLVWCEEAEAADLVPAARTTRRWVLRRAYSHGNAHAMVSLRLTSGPFRLLAMRGSLIAGGLARLLLGLARHVWGGVRGDLQAEARGVWLAYRGAGLISGALGAGWAEYRRDPQPE